MRKGYFNFFIVGVFLILIQTFLQYNEELNTMLKTLYDSVKPFIYAIFIAVLVGPFVKLFENKTKMKRVYAIALSLTIVFLVIIGFILIIVPNIITSIVDFVDKFPVLSDRLRNNTAQLITFLENKNMLYFNPKEIEQNIVNFIKINLGNIKNIIFGVGVGVLSSVIGFINFSIGIFISLYLMYSKEYFMKFLEKLFKLFTTNSKAEYGVFFIRKINDLFLKYMWGRVLTSLVVGVIVFIILLIGKVPYALLSGVLLGVGSMIPYVGSILAGTIATFLILLVSPIKVLILFVAIVIGQTIEGFLIGPKIMADSVGMSSFWTIISIMVCGNLFGPIGMFFGVPIFAVIKFIYLECLKKRGIINEEEI